MMTFTNNFRERVERDMELMELYNEVYYYEDGEGIEYYAHEDLSCDVATGASKIAMLYPQKGVVIKLPATKEIWYEYPVDSDEPKEHEADHINYCEIELTNYDRAKAEGLEKAFVACEYIGRLNEIPTYMAEYAEPFSFSDNISNEVREKVSKSVRDDDLEYDWGTSIWSEFVAAYGLEFCKNLTVFCRENEINDIYERNCGRVNGRPVLIDYSGYEGC